MARIALIHPRFEVSYWGQEYAMPIAGKRANLPPAALPLLASITPEEHTVSLFDENVEELDLEFLSTYDLVGITGMSVQRFRMRAILEHLKRNGVFTIVGGAWVTVREQYFGNLADVIFVGEAEETWPQFLDEWSNGKWSKRYEQSSKSDVSKLPAPRFDLLKMGRYLYGSIQVSRGCPFVCEFCDIIVTFGRRPRVKFSEQVIAELEQLRREGMFQVFVVDDNFIANKKDVTVILKALIEYQKRNHYAFRFFTEATLDLAEEDELMRLMVEANFTAVFIGIESPKVESLKETRKYQNVRPAAGSMLERVHRVQAAGMEVWCGMIAGFDNDDPSIFRAQTEFIQQALIPHVMIGMLYAIPKTPLYARLRNEERLDETDVSPFGTNVIPKNMTRSELKDGYIHVMRSVHEATIYFDSIEQLYLKGKLGRQNQGRVQYWDKHWVTKFKMQLRNLLAAMVLFRRLMTHVRDPSLRRVYCQRLFKFMKKRDASLILLFLSKCAVHYHNHRLSEALRSGVVLNTM